ncbi:MAG: GlsB/YeaQ/YmgE family stress response membrane protein [Rhodospirillaceae bacterium]|nr:GlsB/YeaQ/YmgE family stress response membrane protein [Rhodospirillaceae bacterium]
MGILSWIVLGLVAGALAKLVMPGRDPGGIFITILIGIVGAVVGGFIASALGLGTVSGFNVRSILVAAGGAILLLFAFRAIKGR